MEIDFKKIAENLVGRTVDNLVLCKSGRNSRVYKVICGNDVFAMKSYPLDFRDRFGTETRALKYYEESRNQYTPRLLAVDASLGVAMMEWLDGNPVKVPSIQDIDCAVDFIERTHAARNLGVFELAAEPCLSGEDLYAHIEVRLAKLMKLPELKHYLTQEIVPVLNKARLYAENPKFSRRLASSYRTLIPADFGFHNALKSDKGSLHFIDFEYFGWDDPVRLTADFLFHPSAKLETKCYERFQSGMVALFQEDADFERRLLHLMPLYGVRWALILLNEFLPERWMARVFAGEADSWEDVKQKQLKKSKSVADKSLNSMKLL